MQASRENVGPRTNDQRSMGDSESVNRFPASGVQADVLVDSSQLQGLLAENQRLQVQLRRLHRQQEELLDTFGRIQNQELRLREELLQKALFLDAVLLSEVDFFFKDRHGRYLLMSRGTAAKLKGPGASPFQLVGSVDDHFFSPETAQRHLEQEAEVLRQGRVTQREETDDYLDGRRKQVLVTRGPIWDPGGKIIGTYGFVRDITEVASLRRQIEAILETSTDAVVLVDDTGSIILANPAVRELFGYAPVEVLGSKLENLLGPRDLFEELVGDPYSRKGGLRERAREVTGYRKEGTAFPGELSLSEVELDGQKYFVGILRDISERKEAERRLKELAELDGLTGFYNQSLFPRKLEERLKTARSRRYVVVVADLDRFKPVNDVYGHEVGDRLLAAVAERIRCSVKQNDLLGRIGGDEFGIGMDFMSLPSEKGLEEVLQRRLGEIRRSVSQPYRIDDPDGGNELLIRDLSISLGYAVFDKDGSRARDLVRIADQRMYQNKTATR